MSRFETTNLDAAPFAPRLRLTAADPGSTAYLDRYLVGLIGLRADGYSRCDRVVVMQAGLPSQTVMLPAR
jgi:hypothetical protein